MELTRQLVEQNTALKKEMAIAERKLLTRNDRIQNLESLLHAADQKLTARNQKYEAQLAGIRERLAEGEPASIMNGRRWTDAQLKRSSRAGMSMGALQSRCEVEEDRVDMGRAMSLRRLCISRSRVGARWDGCSTRKWAELSGVSGVLWRHVNEADHPESWFFSNGPR